MRWRTGGMTIGLLASLLGCGADKGQTWPVLDAGRPSGAGGAKAGAGAHDASMPRDSSMPRDASGTGGRAPKPDAGPRDASSDASQMDATVDAGAVLDPFGVRMLYPTIAAGREWYLPDDADKASEEWNVESNAVTHVSGDAFHTVGNNGEVRLSVASPSGRAWFRNVEMTGYFRYTAPMDSNGQERHWEFLARGERHSSSMVNGNSINGGVSAPAGTATWPGYPFGDVSLNGHCLGSSYHGNFHVDGYGWFEKEVSHSNGYAPQHGKTTAANFADPLGRWFGYKFVLQNADGDQRVHFELWLDADANGDWQRLTEGDDTIGSWAAGSQNLDGCTAAPFSYEPDQLMTWAGPWVIFRSDSIAIDFRWLSAREIAPLP